MSQINVNTIRNRTGGPPNLDKGAVVTGILTCTGNVSVGGTLTYEDVTNIDSTGIVTAKSGIKVGNPVSPGIGATIDPNGNAVFAGIVTASQFSGIDTDKISEGNTEVETIDTGSDGHVKMTTEGSERLRVGPAGQIGLSGANYGTAGQLLTSSGNASAASWTSVNPAPTVEATADGAISAGDAVIVKTDGDVTKVVQTVAVNNPPTAGSRALIATDNLRRPAACYVPDGNKIVIAAHNASSSNPLAYNVGDVTDAGAITWGASWPNIDTENIQAMPGLCYDTTNDRVVVLYYSTTSTKIWSKVGTISGTSISWGSRVEVFGADSNNFRCQRLLFDPTNSKVIALYRAGGSNNPRARVGTVSGTSISWGTESAMNSVESTEMDMAYDPDTQRIIAISKAQSGSEATCKIGTVSGTDITWGANNAIDAGQPSYCPTVAYDTKNNKVVVQYETNSNVTKYKVGTVTGGSTNTIAWSSAGDVVTSDVNNQEIFFDAFSERLVSFYRDSNGDVWVKSGSLSGSTITWGNPYKIEDDTVPSEYSTGVILQNGIVALIAQNGSGYFESDSAILGNGSSNATTENFIGFAREAAANNTTAKIDVTGATNITQSGLTPGQQYFVQNNGTLGLTAATPRVYAGTAVASGKLIVGNDTPPIPVTQTVEHVATVDSTGQTYIEFTGITTSNVAKHVIVLNAITQGGTPGALANGLRAQVYLSGTYNNWLTANQEYDYRTTLKEWNTGTVENWYQNQNYFKINRDDSDYQISGEVTIYNNMFGASSGSTGDKWFNFDMFGSNTGFMNGKGRLDGWNSRQNQVTGIRFYSAASYWLHGRADLYRFSRPT